MNGQGKFLTQASALVAIIVGVFAVILPLYASDSPVDSQVQQNEEAINERIDEVESLIQRRIVDDEICTKSNPTACEDLFNRLAANISRVQRKRLACAVVRFLNKETVTTTFPCENLRARGG